MKQITCAQMGGPETCTTVFTGTSEEIVKAATEHVMTAHPEIAEKMKAMTPEENAAWMSEFQAKYDALPEM